MSPLSLRALIGRFGDTPREEAHAACIGKHVDKHFPGAHVEVMHEFFSIDQLHLDVYIISPKHGAHKVLLTSGMSSMSMTNDSGDKDFDKHRYAELMMIVPPGTSFSNTLPNDGPNDWIVSVLKHTARFPHIEGTWVGQGHSIQANADLSPYSDEIKYAGVMLLPSVTYPVEVTRIKCRRSVINIHGVFPMYREEMEFKIANGSNAFIDLLKVSGLHEVIVPHRKSLIQA